MMVKRFLILFTFGLFIASITNLQAASPQQSGSLAKIVKKKAKADTSAKSQKGSLKSITEKNLQTKKQPSSQQSIKPKILAEKSKTLEIPKTEPEESSNLLYIIIGALAFILIILVMRKGGKEEATLTSDQNDVAVDTETTIEDTESDHEVDSNDDKEDESTDKDEEDLKDDESDEIAKKPEKKKENNNPVEGAWNVPPPQDAKDDYVKISELNIFMDSRYKYWIGNDGRVWRASANFNEDLKNNFEDSSSELVADGIDKENGYYYFIDDDGDVCSTDKEHIYEAWNDWIEQNAVYDKKAEYESQQALEDEKIDKEIELRSNIIELLKNNTEKFTASDIDARLNSFDVDLIKEICEELYHEGTINRTGNYRYYIFSEDIVTNENDNDEEE